MKITYDPIADALYIYFKETDIKVARTETVALGVFADFDGDGKLIGLEVLKASEVMDKK
jgi:uncharacterized protein YuzE